MITLGWGFLFPVGSYRKTDGLPYLSRRKNRIKIPAQQILRAMATISFRLANYVRKDKKQQVQMWVYSGDTEKPVDTGVKVPAKQWDSKRSRIRPAYPNAAVLNALLDKMEEAVEKSFAEIKGKGGAVTAERIAEDAFVVTDFHAYLQEVIDTMDGPTQFSAQGSYKTLKKMLLEFRPKLNLQDIDLDFLNEFEAFLRARPGTTGKGLLDSTLNKRMVQLAAVYNSHKKRAHPSPFEFYKMPSSENLTEYEPLEDADIEAIWNAKTRTWTEATAKEVFLFCYYAAGMRPGDALSLEWSEVGEKEIVYLEGKKEHQKKKRKVHVEINPRLAELLSRRNRAHHTVFGILTGPEEEWRKEIKDTLAGLRNDLKMLALRAGVTKWVSFKIMRHTFAHQGEEKTDILKTRHAMNHGTTKMTEKYTGRNIKTAIEVQRAVYGSTTAPEPEQTANNTGNGIEIRRYRSGGG